MPDTSRYTMAVFPIIPEDYFENRVRWSDVDDLEKAYNALILSTIREMLRDRHPATLEPLDLE